jgi:CIC family chloride channel protein
LIGKIVATSLTLAIGGSGGIFAPTLFMGAMLGTAYGGLLHAAWPDLTGPAGAYGLVGMGALFAAAARAPMTAVISILELTGEYQMTLPLMLAVTLAAGIGRLLSRDTIFSRLNVARPRPQAVEAFSTPSRRPSLG